jgi:hypothetical protein
MPNDAQTGDEWNPYFVAYARVHGRTTDEQMRHDEEAWPGGKMTGFTLWIREQWAAWWEWRKTQPAPLLAKTFVNYIKSEEDHASFAGRLASL